MQPIPIRLSVPEVSHCGDDDPPFSILNFISDRFVFTRAPLFGVGISGRENGQVFSWPPHIVIEFVFSMHPLGRDTLHDRVVGLPYCNLERMPGTMTG